MDNKNPAQCLLLFKFLKLFNIYNMMTFYDRTAKRTGFPHDDIKGYFYKTRKVFTDVQFL